MDSAKLAAALEFSTPTSATDGIVVLRNGNIVAERYYGSFTETTLHDSFSVAKSFTSTLVAIAQEQGLVETLDQKLCSYYPAEWDCEAASDPRSRITIQHAMNLTTSLQWDEDWRGGVVTVNDTVIGAALGMVSYVLGKPAQGEPGGAQRYSTGDPALLTQVIQEVSGENALAFARKNLFAPLGISSVEWSSDGSARTNTFAGLRLAVRDYAKLGVLYANDGMWEGKRLLPEGWTATLSTGHGCSDVYRNLFHVNAPVRLGTAKADCEHYPFCERTSLANLPADGFFASGLTGQYIFVFPSADLVVARFASDSGGSEDWVGYSRGMLERVFDSMLP
jgi:CubicO group peptidase (beta-lactamase class C family)